MQFRANCRILVTQRLSVEVIYSIMAILGLVLIPLKSFSSAWDSGQTALLSLNRIETIEKLNHYDRTKIFQRDPNSTTAISSENAFFSFNFVTLP